MLYLLKVKSNNKLIGKEQLNNYSIQYLCELKNYSENIAALQKLYLNCDMLYMYKLSSVAKNHYNL